MQIFCRPIVGCPVPSESNQSFSRETSLTVTGISPTYDNAQNAVDFDFRHRAHLPPPTSVHGGISPPLKTSVRTGANLGAIVGDACQVYNNTISVVSAVSRRCADVRRCASVARVGYMRNHLSEQVVRMHSAFVSPHYCSESLKSMVETLV